MKTDRKSSRTATPAQQGPNRRQVLQGAGAGLAAAGAGSMGLWRPARAASFEGQTVTVAVGSFMSSGATIFKDQWEEATGGRVDVVEIPFGDLYQRLFTAFTTGAEQFDVAIYAANWIPEFAQSGQIASLENYYGSKDNWDSVLPKTQKIMFVGGERYSVPLDGDVIFGYYRTDALDNAEHQKKFEDKFGYALAAPATWSQYRDIAEFFTGWDWSGSGRDGWGVLEAQKPKDVGPFILSSRAASYTAHPDVPGSFFFDPDTMEPQVGNPGWVQALEDWIEIRKYGPPEMATYGGGEMRGNFIAGNYALGIDWADVGIMAQDEDASIIKGKLGYFVLPGEHRVWNIRTGAWDEYDNPQAAHHISAGAAGTARSPATAGTPTRRGTS